MTPPSSGRCPLGDPRIERLLVIAPHPDDETLAVGGTMHRFAACGGLVDVAVCVVPGPHRLSELSAACRPLGVSQIRVFLDTTPENTEGRVYLDAGPQAPLIDWIDDLIQTHRYDAVLCPPPFGYHQEHRTVSAATLAAVRPTAGTYRHGPRLVAHYEHAADNWGPAAADQPTVYVELDETDVAAKCNALNAHGSQLRPPPSERSWTSLEAMLTYRGMQAGVTWAEALIVRRWVL